MCVAVFIAAEVPLPLIPHAGEDTMLCALELRPGEEGIVEQFSEPFVCYIGSYLHCGCGFCPGAEPGSVEKGRRSLQALSEYLSEALRLVDTVELFVCWEGEELQKPAHRLVMTPEEVGRAEIFCSAFFHASFVTVTRRPEQLRRA